MWIGEIDTNAEPIERKRLPLGNLLRQDREPLTVVLHIPKIMSLSPNKIFFTAEKVENPKSHDLRTIRLKPLENELRGEFVECDLCDIRKMIKQEG